MKKTKHISGQLLSVLIPMIALFIIAVAAVIFISSRSLIIDKGKSLLESESAANANDIGRTMGSIIGYYSGLADVIESSVYEDDAALFKALAPGMEEYKGVVIDCYVAFSDKSFYDGGGWVPDADYDPTVRAWYQAGFDSKEMVVGAPSVDMTTGNMVVCISRSLKMLDGREGVLSCDVVLSGISEAVSAYTPAGTGRSMLLSGTVLIASPEEEYVGTDVSEHADDAFLQAASVATDSDKARVIKGNDGQAYYVSNSTVFGTDWSLISYVKQNDILSDLNRLTIFVVVLVIIMLVVSTFIIMILIKRMVTSPVTDLTGTITRIADGDFTVDIKDSGSNEIGVMNRRMRDYVAHMRSTLSEMQEVTHRLTEESNTSRSAATSMSEHADEQSDSMEQIHVAMEGIANSVTELANNATELAQAVEDMSEQGNSTKQIMNELLERAKQGQSDMENVQRNMSTISGSMSEMSTVVQSVDQAAQKITSIIEMINSISSQTNLLSLNASIEAARAGEAGRGFAVVAGEIGALASDSANATTEISKIIGDIAEEIRVLSERSEESVKDIAASSEAVRVTGETFIQIFTSLDSAGATVNEMVDKMSKVNEIAMSVAAIAEEQSASTEEVTATVETAAESASDVAQESRKVDESAFTVADSSSKISDFVGTFTI